MPRGDAQLAPIHHRPLANIYFTSVGLTRGRRRTNSDATRNQTMQLNASAGFYLKAADANRAGNAEVTPAAAMRSNRVQPRVDKLCDDESFLSELADRDPRTTGQLLCRGLVTVRFFFAPCHESERGTYSRDFGSSAKLSGGKDRGNAGKFEGPSEPLLVRECREPWQSERKCRTGGMHTGENPGWNGHDAAGVATKQRLVSMGEEGCGDS